MAGSQWAGVGGVVLTGGGAVRLQGADKASAEIGGRTMLEHVLAALADVPEVVVVGDEVLTSRPVGFTREDPPRGGPAAGLIAGLAGFPRLPGVVVVVAVDMPLVTTATVSRLLTAVKQDGALLVDEEGRRQYLCAAYRTSSLLATAPPLEQQHGLPMRRLVSGLRLAEVAASPGETRDVDTWEDLTELRERFDR